MNFFDSWLFNGTFKISLVKVLSPKLCKDFLHIFEAHGTGLLPKINKILISVFEWLLEIGDLRFVEVWIFIYFFGRKGIDFSNSFTQILIWKVFIFKKILIIPNPFGYMSSDITWITGFDHFISWEAKDSSNWFTKEKISHMSDVNWLMGVWSSPLKENCFIQRCTRSKVRFLFLYLRKDSLSKFLRIKRCIDIRSNRYNFTKNS